MNHHISAALARERARELAESRAKASRKKRFGPRGEEEIPPFTTPVVRELPVDRAEPEGELW